MAIRLEMHPSERGPGTSQNFPPVQGKQTVPCSSPWDTRAYQEPVWLRSRKKKKALFLVPCVTSRPQGFLLITKFHLYILLSSWG